LPTRTVCSPAARAAATASSAWRTEVRGRSGNAKWGANPGSVLAMTGGGVGRVGDWQRLLWAVADAVQAHAQLSGNEA